MIFFSGSAWEKAAGRKAHLRKKTRKDVFVEDFFFFIPWEAGGKDRNSIYFPIPPLSISPQKELFYFAATPQYISRPHPFLKHDSAEWSVLTFLCAFRWRSMKQVLPQTKSGKKTKSAKNIRHAIYFHSRPCSVAHLRLLRKFKDLPLYTWVFLNGGGRWNKTGRRV